MAIILIVDDRPLNIETLTLGLGKEYTLHSAKDGKEALELATQLLPDLILLDIMMPKMDGFTVCRHLKNQPTTADIPVIFLTALDEPNERVRGLEVGGADYITKPFSIDEVKARIRIHLALRQQRQLLEKQREQDQRYFAQMNQFRDELLAQLQHDVRSPLASIKTNLYLIGRLCETDDPRLTEYTNRANLAVNEVVRMLESTLEIATLAMGRSIDLRVVEIHPFIQPIIALFESLCEVKNITLTVQYQEVDPSYYAVFDAEQMTSVLKNLIGNAIKYTQAGGRVTLIIHPQNNQFQFSVIDTGRGIAAEHLPHLFQRFYRVPAERDTVEGTGLGLYIAKTIVELHQGTIQVESEEGKGTIFSVAIPQQHVAST